MENKRLRKLELGFGLAFIFATVSCRSPNEETSNQVQPSYATEATASNAMQEDRTEEYVQGSLYRFEPILPASFFTDTPPLTEEKIILGRMLFFDKRLSKNHDISCNTCHVLDQYGVDGKKTSPGHRAQLGSRNSPTVYNAAGHFVQFWDGRSVNVEQQATQPIVNPLEMAMPDEKRVVETLKSMPGYVEAFKNAFPSDSKKISLANVAIAMGAFERRLVTPSKWDQFLAGNKSALNAAEQQGFLTFVNTGCVTCHLGTLVGGSLYQKVGAVKPWPNQKDQGRYEVTKKESDRMVFKVPSLRNIEKTAPYFHDGSASTLDEAVKMMGRYQLGRELPDKDIQSIIVWLNTLTGKLPVDYIKEPPLPESTPKTPKADPT